MFSHLREDFPTLRGDNAPTYLDNACVTLKPDSVINSISDYYSMYPGCGGRSDSLLIPRVYFAENVSATTITVDGVQLRQPWRSLTKQILSNLYIFTTTNLQTLSQFYREQHCNYPSLH